MTRELIRNFDRELRITINEHSRALDALENTQMGGRLVVDKVYGSDATGSRGGLPYATLEAALVDATAGSVVVMAPGVHAVAADITIPDDVSIIGVDHTRSIIARYLVTTDATLFTMGDRSSLANLQLRLTSAEHHTLKGLVFPGVTAETVGVYRVTLLVDNSTAPVAGTSAVTGVYSQGISTLVAGVDAIANSVIDVRSNGQGDKRGLLLDTTGHQLSTHAVDITVTRGAGTGSYIGVETNHASATHFVHAGLISGYTADIAQTLGTIQLNGTTLVNANANALGFTTVVYPSTFVFSDPGAVPNGVTRYMRIGSATVSAIEVFIRVATKCILKSLSLRAVTGPGAARVDTITVRKNGVSTVLETSLTGAAVANIRENVSVTFERGDTLSMMIVTAASSTLQDIVAVVEAY